MRVIVNSNGDIEIIGHAEKDRATMEALGLVAHVERGGHVLPANTIKRLAFKLVRRVWPDLTEWTRTWSGDWIVILAKTGQRVGGKFKTRKEAILFEENYLADRL